MKNDFAIAAMLIAIEALVLLGSRSRLVSRVYNVLPSVFWIYLIPGLAAAAGLIHYDPQQKPEAPVFALSSELLLPAALVLLLLSVDLPALLRLGRTGMVIMLAGSVGIIVGGPLVILLLGHWMPPKIWLGLGALSACWIGGTANMVAVKEAVGTPNDIYSLMQIMDTVLSYSWMGLLVALSSLRRRFDHWNRSDGGLLEDLGRRMAGVQASAGRLTLRGLPVLFAVAAAGSAVAYHTAERLPAIPGFASLPSWRIILASVVGVLLSLTRLRRLEALGSTRLGYILLFFVLATFGAKADFSRIGEMPVLLLAGVIWLAIHGSILVLASRLLRTPMFLAATASQANVGGPVSAPVVAEAYLPGLASVGLLMAIVGAILGTFLGLLCTQLCYWAALVVGKA